MAWCVVEGYLCRKDSEFLWDILLIAVIENLLNYDNSLGGFFFFLKIEDGWLLYIRQFRLLDSPAISLSSIDMIPHMAYIFRLCYYSSVVLKLRSPLLH